MATKCNVGPLIRTKTGEKKKNNEEYYWDSRGNVQQTK